MQQSGEHRLGQVAGDQGGDRDAQLGARQLERQRAVRALDELGRGARRVRAFASTVLRSSAVRENSAATNIAVPAVSTTKASSAERGDDEAHRVHRRMSAGPGARRTTGGFGVVRLVAMAAGPEAGQTGSLDGCLRHVIPFARLAVTRVDERR